MTHRPHPRRSGNPDRTHHPLPGPYTPGEPEDMTERAQCTCTGGPYIHGPEGFRQALQEIADRPPHEPPAEGDADHE